MPASWGSFQSAIQLVTGTNIALYALPNLGQPVIETETRRWVALVEASRDQGEELRRLVRAGNVSFQASLRGLERKTGAVRHFALWVAALAAVALLKSSAYPDAPPDPILWAVIGIGAVPSVVLAGLNLRARRKAGEAANRRHDLQARCEAAR
jgi:hypothetical protein